MFWQKAEQSGESIRNLLPASAAFLGLGLIRLWTVNLQAVELTCCTDYPLVTVFRIAELVAIVVLLLYLQDARCLHRSGLLFLGGPACMTASTLLLGVAELMGQPAWLLTVALVVGAVGFATMLLLWLEVYGCLPTGQSLMAYAASYIITIITWNLLDALDSPEDFLVLLTIPAASALMMLLGFTDHRVEHRIALDDAPRTLPRLASLWRLLFWVACFSFVAGYFNTDNPDLSGSLSYLATGLAIILLIVFLRERFDAILLYRISIPCILVGLIIAPALPIDNIYVALLTHIGKELACTVALMIACNMAYHRRFTAAFSAGAVYFVNLLMLSAGSWVENAFTAATSWSISHSFAVFLGFAVLCLVASLVVFNEDHFYLHRDVGGSLSDASISPKPGVYTWDEVNAAVAKLSLREREIVYLLWQGKATAEIGNELFISPGTVRSHINHICTKLELENREALLEAMTRIPAEPPEEPTSR